MAYRRNRLLYAGMIVIVIILGLCSRKLVNVMPNILNTYLGDALWALMIYIGFGFVFIYMKPKKVSLIGLLFCYLIELSQLYHASWIDNIRKTTLGGLILGYAFSWSDLLAYAIGIGVGVIIDISINGFLERKESE